MNRTELMLSSDPKKESLSNADFARASDIDLFNKEMYAPSSVSKVEEKSVADKVIEKFSSMSEDMNSRRNAFDEQLSKAIKTGSTDDVYAATKAMSNYYLQAAMTTKIASKATSAIDRLTNLQ